MFSTGFIWILLFFLPYGLIHSWMASHSFKAFLEGKWPGAYRRFYRLFYNVFAFLTFLPVFVLSTVFPNAGLYRTPNPWGHVFFGLQIVSLILFIVVLFQTSPLSFAGLRQLFDPPADDEKGQLVTGGFYRLVRHPLYLFALLFLWLNPNMSWNTLAFNIGSTLYFLIGMIFEERKLLREFGEEYARYKREIPALIPFLKFNR
jgi:protein-S-isoprenylcysteine O-methyltransferase Ste14